MLHMHCLPLLERLAPRLSVPDLTLERFVHSPTYHLELVDAGSEGEVRIEGTDKCSYTPHLNISSMRTADLPDSCNAIARVQASGIRVVPDKADVGKGNSIHIIQGRVITADGAVMYLKPRTFLREPEFDREVRILSRIEALDLRDRIRVPGFQSTVVSGENGETTVGFLMPFINSSEAGSHLLCKGLWGRSELHDKWEKQVTAIVEELHAHDIVWGDVNPMNVVVDDAMDAWVIDFGGNNNVEFVDEDKCETVEGDWQGIRRLFREWLPARGKISEDR